MSISTVSRLFLIRTILNIRRCNSSHGLCFTKSLSELMSGGLAFFAGQCPWAVSGRVWQILRAAVAVGAVYTIGLFFLMLRFVTHLTTSFLSSEYAYILSSAIFILLGMLSSRYLSVIRRVSQLLQSSKKTVHIFSFKIYARGYTHHSAM